jgi:16S rRNA (uracil1498-N3)-methyltransferase
MAYLGKGARFFADPEGQSRFEPPGGSLQGFISLAVGPPGGFTAEEAGTLRMSGFEPISLGNSRLTTETAAIAILAVARNHIK